ncbi:hypothetical protein [Nesterenkonia alkaliphila]|uniref:Uncharacterized protein n=1 Tax=Nesterenkonia alkaliphila TaxID=1463631 RepID=A0A7K1UJN0_9MICC|nr:hypothetical protein [Nesterenkonia alkaliphila]MVT26670.1 hypothetical protein [Nesterenkonia alkaliphila]GFZ77940.1 hypothetical protein GCM10011359_02540 [Nesterenkonia alkaliphila]
MTEEADGRPFVQKPVNIVRPISDAAYLQLDDALLDAGIRNGRIRNTVFDVLAAITDTHSHDGPAAKVHLSVIGECLKIEYTGMTYPSQDEGFRLLTRTVVRYAVENPIAGDADTRSMKEWRQGLEMALFHKMYALMETKRRIGAGRFNYRYDDDLEDEDEPEEQEAPDGPSTGAHEDALVTEIQNLRDSAVEIEEIASITGASRKEIERVLGPAS